MPVTFSKHFNIPDKKIEESGVFDVILDVDTRVFIDPALIDLCTEPEFIGAKSKIETYFSNIITLLKHSKHKNDMYWVKANRLLAFREITGTCFGYSQNGTDGNAIGPELRNSILNTIKELLDAGETDPVLFELLGVFQEGIGCDRVSDLITFILIENILEYTQRVTLDADIKFISISYHNKQYMICVNPYNNKTLLLLPEVLLSPLPVADGFDDIDRICQENERVRQEINAYFDLGGKKKLHKSQIHQLLQRNLNFRAALVSAYKTIPKIPYNFEADPAGEYAWFAASKDFADRFPLDLSGIPLNSNADVCNVATTICNHFKTLIEDHNLSKLLYNEDGSAKHESVAQLLFYGIADSYCDANNIDLTKEGNNGRGPVDFKLSRGARSKIVIETKLTSNPQLIHGIEVQLPIYMTQENTNHAIYLVIDTGHTTRLNNFIKYYNELSAETKKKISYILVDASSKQSASKA